MFKYYIRHEEGWGALTEVADKKDCRQSGQNFSLLNNEELLLIEEH